MSTDAKAATADAVELPDEPFVAGVHAGGLIHAIRREYAFKALTEAWPGVHAECGRLARVATARPSLSGWLMERCPHCMWAVAIQTGTVDAHLDAITPTGRDHDVLQRLIGEPAIARHICEAVIDRTEDEYGLDHGHTLQVLATVAAHAPTLAVPEDCGEDDSYCQHRPADLDPFDSTWRCSYPDAAVVCPTCTLQAGDWAGEWQGQYMDECYVYAPCQVLTAIADHYGVALARPGEDPELSRLREKYARLLEENARYLKTIAQLGNEVLDARESRSGTTT